MTTTLSRFTGRVPGMFDEFRREMDDMLQRFWDRDLLGEDGNGHWFSPQVNVAETENEFEISVDLPGMNRDDVNVELRHGDLWITGVRKEEHEDKQKNWHRVERRYGEFRRVIPLRQEVDPDKVEAEYKDGVLKISVPKTEEQKPKRIPVKG